MRLLLTNDDGIDAPGIQTLYRILSQKHQVQLMAPHVNRSAVSHCVIMNRPMKIHRRDENSYALEGFPADCIVTGLKSGIFSEKPDAVISGINDGANIGTDVIYSGTCAGARQGALYGIPSIAVSLSNLTMDYSDEMPAEKDFSPCAEFVCNNLEKLLSLCSKEKNPDGSLPYFVNVNASYGREHKGVKYGCVSYRDYGDRVCLSREEDGSLTSRFLFGTAHTYGAEESEYELLLKGYITVSLLHTNPVYETIRDDTGGFVL